MNRLSKKDKNIFLELSNYFKKEFNIDVMSRTRGELMPNYRSLFNMILLRRYKMGCYKIASLYRFYGWESKHHATILNSFSKFKKYKNKTPEISNHFYELYPKAKQDKERYEYLKALAEQNSTPIQKAVTNLKDNEANELLEMINLRKKSWEWKNKDKTKVYTSF
eukprot:GHVR01168268.1.p1 GENE.GHVR01168268.1~~GHVR01168268.1.p1  ORF type:complete len:165 (+),score=17.71 GHVR01168268.1:273-767(+)